MYLDSIEFPESEWFHYIIFMLAISHWLFSANVQYYVTIIWAFIKTLTLQNTFSLFVIR